MTESQKTYVFQDTEVKLTSRTANKELKPVRRQTGKEPTEPTVATLYEITPVDPENGSWKKWVRIVELFEIK